MRVTTRFLFCSFHAQCGENNVSQPQSCTPDCFTRISPTRAPQREHKLASYTLNAVAEHFLADRKEEVPYAHIAALFAGGADSVQRLARYCVKDAWLPLRLMRHLSSLVNQVRLFERM